MRYIPGNPIPNTSQNPQFRIRYEKPEVVPPTKKQVEPIANRTPIHHDARRGAHQTPLRSGRESIDACLRWTREDHELVLPSGRSQVTCVANGPTVRRSVSR